MKPIPEYIKYTDVFSQKKVNTLLEDPKYDHHINMILQAKSAKGPIYSLSKKGFDAL